MFKQKKLLNNIFINSDSSDEYIIFEHGDKTWLMPSACIKPAFDMYQPSTIKGKALKQLAICCKGISFVAKKMGIKKDVLSINRNIKDYVKDLVGTENFYIAGYMGDTSSKQNNKATLQVYNKERLLCYVKVTADDEIADTFNYEIERLQYLEQQGVSNIPKVLGQNIVDGMHIFTQSTKKRVGKKLFLGFKEKQIYFIKRIVDITKKELDYIDTDFAKYVNYLKDNVGDFKLDERIILNDAVSIVEEKLSKKPEEYAFSHGDFTPWNVYYVDGTMEAFDFEYCNYSMPCYIDVFHYLTQLSVLGKKNDVGGTVHLYKKHRKLLDQYICDPDFTYACYLIYIISFYKQRTESSADISEKYRQWIGILEYVLGKIKKDN